MHKLFTYQQVKDLLGVNTVLAHFAMWLLRLNKINKMYDKLYPATGYELLQKGYEYLNIKVEGNLDKLYSIMPEKGSFITISNHPFGFLDGLTMVLLVGKKRSGVKITANFLLQQMKPLEKFFISVNPFDGKLYKGMGGKKTALEHLDTGEPLVLFPAGQVSTWQKNVKGVIDRQWKPAVVSLIKDAEVPVIPVFFHGQNSISFHVLGIIHPLLRTIRLPAEFLKKRDSSIKISVGDMITVQQQKDYKNLQSFSDFLREKLYKLKDNHIYGL